MLTIFPMLTKEEAISRLPKLWKAIDCESLPSTRHFIEWIIILIYLKYGGGKEIDGLMARFSEFSMPTGSAISLLTISMHVGSKIEGELRQKFYSVFFHRLLPWFLHNNHMVRLFSLFVYEKIWEHRQQYRSDVLLFESEEERLEDEREALPEGFSNMAAFISQSEHCKQFTDKLRKEYFLNGFDPLDDYNLQTIYTKLPLENDIAQNECISAFAFMNVLDDEDKNISIPLKCKDDSINYFGSNGTNSISPELNIKNLSNSSISTDLSNQVFRDYQQKIDPWNLELLDQDLSEIRKQQLMPRKSDDFDVIVVASLVNYIPNLGGLCRTCEIFGVAALVIDSLSILEKPEFKNISMTSENWINIQEVKSDNLIEYLQSKRMEDYKIIAIEQTSQSHSLMYYQFPSKVCIVLGNEKEGIPPEVLHCVDDCIEVPQFGMVRSLNVHVCGSLILWEARKQKFLSKNPSPNFA